MRRPPGRHRDVPLRALLDGRVPLHTLRADIDYGFHEAKTTFGRIGVKVWINKGEVLPEGVTDSRGRTDMDAAPRRGARAATGATAAVAEAAVVVVAAAAEAAAVAAAAPAGTGGPADADAEAHQAPQAPPRSPRGALAGQPRRVRRVRPEGPRAGWITNRQIEAARIAMTRRIKRGGKVWINIFPHLPVTKKPAETRMGSGKGRPRAGSPWSSRAASCSSCPACRSRWPATPCASRPQAARSSASS